MKKILCVVLALTLALLCTACGGKTSDEVTITFWTTPVLNDEAKMEEIVADFNENNPGIHVELEYLTWEGVTDKLQIALSTGDTPDVFIDGAARTASLPSLGVLAPVDDVYNKYDDWYASVANFGVIDGVHYLIPATQMGCSVFAVNYSLAEELGVADLLPEDCMSWSMEDLYNFVAAATEAGADQGIKGIGLYAGSQTADDVLYSMMLGNGGSIIDMETMTCVANSPECVEVVEYWGKMVENGYTLDGVTLLKAEDIGTPFKNGQVVIQIGSPASSTLVAMESMKEEGYIDEIPDIRTYGIPYADGLEMVCACWGANGIAVFDNGDEAKIEAAKTFVSYLVESVDYAESIWNIEASYPPARDNGAVYTGATDAITEDTVFYTEITGLYSNSEFGILEPYWPEVRSHFYPELQAVYSGEKTAQEAMDSFAANVNEVLEAYK